jgi:hypothetical protein
MASYSFNAVIHVSGWVDGVADEDAAVEEIQDHLRADAGFSGNIDIDLSDVDDIQVDLEDPFDDDIFYDDDNEDDDDVVGEDG